MDKQIEKGKHRGQQVQNILKYALIVLLIGGLIYGVSQFLRPKAEANQLLMGVVEQGRVENTISAGGSIKPEFEIQLTSPISTRIRAIKKQEGASVKANDVIMELDRSQAELDFAQKKDALELKRNNVQQLQLQLEKDLRALEVDKEIKELQLADLRAQLGDAKRLLSVGGATEEEVEKADSRLKIAGLEFKKLENELTYLKTSLSGKIKSLNLESSIQDKALRSFGYKLNQTVLKAPRPSVITWINQSIGQQVGEGEPLVRLADLNSFKVEGSVSDIHAQRLKLGMPVKLRINNKYVNGSINKIFPAVKDRSIRFDVSVDAADQATFKPNMQVELYIVTESQDNVLRVKNGPVFNGSKSQEIFVVNGNVAEKRRINIGLKNAQFVEVSGNINVGDRIILSNLPQMKDQQSFQLNQ